MVWVVVLDVVNEFINLIEKMGCVNVVRWSREHSVKWSEIKSDVMKGLEGKGYSVRFKGVWMCLEDVRDLDSRIVELLISEGCVHRRKIMELFNLTVDEWKRVKRRVVKLLATKGYRLYKYGYWTYCIEGAKPSEMHMMTVPLFVKIDPETYARLEELAKRKGVSKAEFVREIIQRYLSGSTT
jgi:predicted HicB family RNase H-like nuclease